MFKKKEKKKVLTSPASMSAARVTCQLTSQPRRPREREKEKETKKERKRKREKEYQETFSNQQRFNADDGALAGGLERQRPLPIGPQIRLQGAQVL